MLKLDLDSTVVARCNESARAIALDVQRRLRQLTTVSIERTILRLLGFSGADEAGVPIVNTLVSNLGPERLQDGVCTWLGTVMSARGCDLTQAAAEILEGRLPDAPASETVCRSQLQPPVQEAAKRLTAVKHQRQQLMKRMPPAEPPWFYCIVATGDIFEDCVQATAAARQGAQIIAVIRSTAQSLLDFVPHGATSEGYAGTFATQENFRIMRQALDETGRELGRYIFLCNYCSGLCMPEIAALGALERLDMMLNDATYGIIFRDINMVRTLTDQFFSRRINGWAGIIINTGEDNYLKTDDALCAAHTVVASQFINLHLARLCDVPEDQIGLGHAFEMDPNMEDGFLLELAQALLSRQLFPNAPLKYMPPTRYKTGDIFKGYLQDGLFNLVSLLSRQQIQLLGMLSEAVQTPGVQDRYLALQNARYIASNLKHLGEDLQLRPGGIIESRAREVLQDCDQLLQQIRSGSLFDALEQGVFAGISRKSDQGRGREGVIEKSTHYFNPFEELMRPGEDARFAQLG